MHEHNAEQEKRYFRELTLNLTRAGFVVSSEEDGLLPVELDGQQLCIATGSGGVRYREENLYNEQETIALMRNAALEQVTDIVVVTHEYMGLIEGAPALKVGSLDGDYRLLADFNGTILAGHLTKYGAQFITWSRGPDGTSLNQGNYYGPDCGVSGYVDAKWNFAARSGLVSAGTLFSPEQLTEIYRSVNETLELIEPLTDERTALLESVSDQIEQSIPDLEERVNRGMQAQEELEDSILREEGILFL